MRIAYVVDVHDRFAAVATAVSALSPVDVLVVGGDLTTFGAPDDAERAVELWSPLARRLLAVAGNCDSPAIDERLRELGVSIGGRGAVVGDVGFAGVSAAPHSPLHTPYELPDDEIGRLGGSALSQIRHCAIRIFCPHAPPYGTACDRLRTGEHVGSPALRALVEREQHDVVLCGHIHESRGRDALGTSIVANPGPAAAGDVALVEVAQGVSVTLDPPAG